MATRRTLKAAEAIREVVAMSLLTEIKDPRVKNVTVTSVEVSADMRNAKVYVTVRGGEATQEELALSGLRSAAGFLQQKCARRIDTRYTPRLQFMIDEGIKNLIAVSRILEEEKRAREQEQKTDDSTNDDSVDISAVDSTETEYDADEENDEDPDMDSTSNQSDVKETNQIDVKDQIEEASNEQ